VSDYRFLGAPGYYLLTVGEGALSFSGRAVKVDEVKNCQMEFQVEIHQI
jgi:hypothetical protein